MFISTIFIFTYIFDENVLLYYRNIEPYDNSKNSQTNAASMMERVSSRLRNSKIKSNNNSNVAKVEKLDDLHNANLYAVDSVPHLQMRHTVSVVSE